MTHARSRLALIIPLLAAAACRDGGVAAVAVVDSLVAPGESLYVRGAFDSAAVYWTGALEKAGVVGSPTEARLLHWLGLAAYRQGNYTEARSLGERALTMKRERGLGPIDIAESQNALGLLAWNEGRLSDATALLQEARNGFSTGPDRAGVAKAANNLALVALELGRFAEAREGFGAARAAARAIGNARIEGRATTNLAMIELWSGDPATAPTLLAESRRLADAAADPVGMENAIGQLAMAWSVLGEPGRALATLDSATAIARQHGLREAEANNLLAAAAIHREAGDAERALQLYERARAINRELDLTIETGMVLRSEAILLARRGVLERARSSGREALRLHRTAEAKLEEFRDLIALADLEAEAGEAAAAGKWLAEARNAAVELDAPQIRVLLALAEARAADRRADPGGILAALRPAASDLALAGASATTTAEWLRTRAYASLGRLDSAVAAGRRAVAAAQRSAVSFGSPILRVSATVEQSEVFADLVMALLRVGQSEEAFLVADAARGRALLDHLASAREVARRGAMGADLAERNRLLRAVDALLGRLEEVQARPRQERGPESEATGRELAERLRETRAEYEAVLIRLAVREPTRAGVIGTRSASLAAVRAALAPDEVLIQYFLTPQRLIAFVATTGGLRTLELAVPLAELENRVRLARGLLSSSSRSDSGHTVLEELHRILIGPLDQAGLLEGNERILIVPHGVLAYLPFAALRNPATGRYLVETRSLQYLPTAASLAALRGERQQERNRTRTTVFAPLPDLLPATVVEASTIERTLRGSRRVVAASASESALRRALAEGDAVHIATHGTMNPVNPMFSNLRLARGRAESPEDDGRLEVHELLGITTASPLVFLSGCETALGGARSTLFDQGQDYATLAQAFLYAGAKSVVATLWRIDDEGAAGFAEQFYRGRARYSAVEALAAAQRAQMRHPRWGHPYYWAGYTISGDGPEAPVANRAALSVQQ